MKPGSKKLLAIFLAGVFAKDIVDDIFFLIIDKYPIEVFGFTITASSHKTMLIVSIIVTAVLLYVGLRKRHALNEKASNV